MTQNSDMHKKRAILGGLMKLMFGLLILAGLWIGFSFVGSGDQVGNPVPVTSKRVSLAGIKLGGSDVVEWEGRPVIILNRSSNMTDALHDSGGSGLQDPNSVDSIQPEWAKTQFRSRTLEWFVAIASGSDFGCPVEYLPSSVDFFQGQHWLGGFQDTCRGSRYDLAGRVYVDQPAESNLVIPMYRIEESTLHLGAE